MSRPAGGPDGGTTPARAVGLDVGGANLKFALAWRAGDGADPRVEVAGSVPFPLWRRPAELPDRLARLRERLEAGTPPADGDRPVPPAVGLALTGELADGYRSRAEGVRRIVAAAEEAWPEGGVRVLDAAGRWREGADARGRPLEVAAANWRATAGLLARHAEAALLLDVGSTTSDLVPLRGGRPLGDSRSDLDRLRASELVYTGALRTPVAAELREVALPDGTRAGLAAESFAVMADVHLWRGRIRPSDYACETPDGRGREREDAARRLARMLCSDPEEVGEAGLRALCEAAAAAQLGRLRRAIRRQRERWGDAFPGAAWPTGSGAWLAEEAARAEGLEILAPPLPLRDVSPGATTAAAAALLRLEGSR